MLQVTRPRQGHSRHGPPGGRLGGSPHSCQLLSPAPEGRVGSSSSVKANTRRGHRPGVGRQLEEMLGAASAKFRNSHLPLRALPWGPCSLTIPPAASVLAFLSMHLRHRAGEDGCTRPCSTASSRAPSPGPVWSRPFMDQDHAELAHDLVSASSVRLAPGLWSVRRQGSCCRRLGRPAALGS